MDKVENQLIDQPMIVINLGLEDFAKNLEIQGVEVIRVNWRPPAGGDKQMIELLDQLL
ncbi:MAG: fdrA domain protein [Anaerolineaceae bacterium]|nr:fdrA domain protein [Anaerolineaceae bacterium]